MPDCFARCSLRRSQNAGKRQYFRNCLEAEICLSPNVPQGRLHTVLCLAHCVMSAMLVRICFIVRNVRAIKADSTLRSSQAVPHPSTDRALRCLTSEVKRDPVHSTRYGRRRQISDLRLSSPFLANPQSSSLAKASGHCRPWQAGETRPSQRVVRWSAANPISKTCIASSAKSSTHFPGAPPSAPPSQWWPPAPLAQWLSCMSLAQQSKPNR